MTTLVVGASGATGCLLVEQLLERGQRGKVVVRSMDGLSKKIMSHKNLSIIHASILDLSDTEMTQHVKRLRCSGIMSRPNLAFKGVFGSPRRLMTEATRRLCKAKQSL